MLIAIILIVLLGLSILLYTANIILEQVNKKFGIERVKILEQQLEAYHNIFAVETGHKKNIIVKYYINIEEIDK